MVKNKYEFMAALIERRSLSHGQKEKLYRLIAEEIKSEKSKDKELLQRIEEIENKVKENSKKPLSNYNASTPSYPKNLPHKHNPILTVDFLKNFKYQNDSGFKELVHRPNEDGPFRLKDLLEKVKLHPNIITKFHDRKSDDFEGYIAYRVREETIKLIKFLEMNGLPFNEKTQKHPIENYKILEEIQQFKKNYRFGCEKSESSQLRDLINNVGKKRRHKIPDDEKVFSFGPEGNSGLFNLKQLVFVPEADFDLLASFFTWVPSITASLNWIFDGILKSSNIRGSRNFEAIEKDFQISLKRQRNEQEGYTEVILSIKDNKSWLMKPPESFFSDLRGSDPLMYLNNIADWRIECFHQTEGGLIFDMLSSKEPSWSKDKNIGEYFEHIITFYD